MEGNYINGKQIMVLNWRLNRNVQLAIAAVFAVSISLVMLLAANAEAVENKSTNTLKVSPVRSDVTIEAGTSKKVQTTVTNLTKSDISVRPVQNDFVSGDENGTPSLILDENDFAPTHSLKRFMAPFAETVTIPAGKSKLVEVTINVPKDAQAGGYFGAIRFAPTDPNGGGQVNLNASVASLILLTVPGDVVEKINLTNFDVQQGGKSGNNFSSSNDLQTSIRFENKGGVQIGPIGKISVKQGDKVVYETDFNNKDQRDMILPDGARRWNIPLKNIGSFGDYTVMATFTYGTKNQTLEVERSFWIIPQVAIIATIVGVVVLIALIVGIWLFLRGYKKRVLRNHGHKSSGMKIK